MMHPPEIADRLAEDLRFAIHAARTAGERALHLLGTGRWSDETLGDVVDHACDGLLQGLIGGRYPEDGLLSEETKDSPRRLSKDRTWIVDPLDGTKELRAGLQDWGVHVALTEGGRCVLGAVALPAQDRLLWGVTQPGMESAGLEGTGDWLRGDRERPAGRPLRMAVSRSHTPPWVERLGEELGAELLPAGSVGHKVGLMVTGEADLYAHRVGLKEWDTAAPECVARAMGWHVSRLDGSPQAYNQPDPRNGELLVCRPAARERILTALQRCGVFEEGPSA